MAKEKKEMSFLDHLEELRWLLVRSSFAIVIVATVAFFFSDFIFETILFGPKDPSFVTYTFFCELSKAIGVESFCVTELPFVIQNTDVEGQVSLLVWTCITVGFILAFPYILWEFWKFISPALYENERKNAKTFIFISSLLFFIGVLFGYYVIVPMSINFFATFSVSTQIKNEFNIQSYIGLIKTSVIACGLFFELPIIIYFLTKLGLVTPKFLRDYRRYAIVIVLILAAIVTPPDVVSQIIVAIPLLLLYEVSIFISSVVVKNQLKNEQSSKRIQ
ncbi:MAG: twin-arginine translocase subunit TatC [Flavobacterium sp.]|uniref:twin-arginine translocase subunit TatC n=1 Tax=Flavobacterium sp. TaxID=239 RepID=UPI0022C56E54|nr:twin-arginine translocase subunit TatC [Flavobacterium sp.]MCZ8197237.1 twin-arginine translocase subunit TatC [Flavobacterium sp.]